VTLADERSRSGAVEAIERILNREGEADAILRQAVAVLAERIAAARWVAIAFVEPDDVVVGPVAGDAPGAVARPGVVQPVDYARATVAEIWIDADAEPDAADRAFLGRVADLLSPYCLVGWDTGGEDWEP
jgi:hypothetical protein